MIKIQIKIGGKELELTRDELKELKSFLDEYFGADFQKIYEKYPVYPSIPWFQTYPPPVTYTTSSSDLKLEDFSDGVYKTTFLIRSGNSNRTPPEDNSNKKY